MTAHSAYIDAEVNPDPRFSSVDCVFFVIGAQKAGTTWLSHYLKSHPEVSVPEWKEHDYWNMVEGRPTASRMLLEQKRRRENFSPVRALGSKLSFTLYARRQRAISLALRAVEAPCPPYSAYADVILENVNTRSVAAGEICPEYALLARDTYAKMADLSPNVRFIFLMRDPVARFVSGVMHSMRKTLGKSEVTSENLAQELQRLNVADSRPMSLSRYDMTIERLEAAVPNERILYVFFEDLFEQSKVRDICSFLGLSFLPGKIDAKANSAGKGKVDVAPQDREMIARSLAPVYAFMSERFGSAMPRKWQESAALC